MQKKVFRTGIIFCLLISVGRVAVSFSPDSLSYEDLLALKEQLTEEVSNNQQEIDANTLEILALNKHFADSHNDRYPICNIAYESTNQTSVVLNGIGTGLSIASSLFTVSSPAWEFRHNYLQYYRGLARVSGLSYGLPLCDFSGNGLYLIHLGLHWANGGNFWTFVRNGIPSMVSMAIDAGVLGSLVLYRFRRTHQGYNLIQ